MFDKNFGEIMRTYRKEKKISLRKMEELTGVSFSHLSKIERGEYTPSRETVENIANELELDEDMCLISAGYAPKELMKPLKESPEPYNSLDEINKLIKEYGIEQMGFFDIEQWKNLSPQDVKMVEEHFKMIVKLAKERNEEKE